MKPTLISGIQPTGKLHIGNYLGALKNFVELQNSGKYECFFFIADLHALTENPEPKELQKNIADLAATFLAAGLNAQKSTLFIQSQNPAHTELAWILNTITPPGDLFRMTQFKEKTKILFEYFDKKHKGEKRFIDEISEESANDLVEKTNFGLLDYPVLMASDILLYNTEFVPVGEDQLQHLELTRTLARKFNSRFGKTFVEPKALMTSTPRLMSLDNPEKKMSKSLPNGCLFIGDNAKIMKEKIMRAVTDSGKEIKYDEKNKPAISNLMLIYASLINLNEVGLRYGSPTSQLLDVVEKKYKNKGYADFKKDLVKIVADYFTPFQKKKMELVKKKAAVLKIFENGGKKAKGVADKKIAEVKEKIGLI